MHKVRYHHKIAPLTVPVTLAVLLALLVVWISYNSPDRGRAQAEVLVRTHRAHWDDEDQRRMEEDWLLMQHHQHLFMSP